MTAWIGETQWLLSPSSWEPQASAFLTHEALSQKERRALLVPCRACQPVSAQSPGWVLKKRCLLDPTSHALSSSPFLCPHCSSDKGVPPPPPPSLPVTPRLESALVGEEELSEGI